jgi:hypothetical protein
MGELTPTMKLCLERLEGGQGIEASELPGGKNTIAALMRRGEVEIDREQHVFLPAHTHAFKTTMHLDGCHHYRTQGACACGVVYGSYSERDAKDPYSAVWMDNPERCARCRRLLQGARPAREVVIERPRNYRMPS